MIEYCILDGRMHYHCFDFIIGNSKLSGLHLAATKNDVNMITAIIKVCITILKIIIIAESELFEELSRH